jgi:hypothetical protein
MSRYRGTDNTSTDHDDARACDTHFASVSIVVFNPRKALPIFYSSVGHAGFIDLIVNAGLTPPLPDVILETEVGGNNKGA